MSITLNFATLLLSLLLLTIPSLTLQQQPKNPNLKLEKAYKALQAWKKSITSDPNNFTSNWNGCDVCNYTGIYCAPSLENPTLTTVAGIDLNHANIAGTIPDEVGLLLTDLTLIHLNSNRFFGPIPLTFCHLTLLHELDLSNNMFCGDFPNVLLSLHSLKFLDIRFNNFEGTIPPSLFDLKLDAVFLNNNNFTSYSLKSLANSTVSVLVLANNKINGCFPSEITKMGETLEELILLNSGLKGCLPENIGELSKLTVLDVSFNDLTGKLPESIGNMKKLEQLDVASNKFYGEIPTSICCLPNLQNFTYSNNYFFMESPICMGLKVNDDKFNCIPFRPLQRSPMECHGFLSYLPNCNSFGCSVSSPPRPLQYKSTYPPGYNP